MPEADISREWVQSWPSIHTVRIWSTAFIGEASILSPHACEQKGPPDPRGVNSASLRWQPKSQSLRRSLTDLDNLPEPDELAEEIIENLEAGLDSFREVLAGLEKVT